MKNYVNDFIRYFEISIENKAKKDEFSKTLRELVTILFAVVFATSLQEILTFHIKDSFWFGHSFWLFIIANIAVVLSWYGYHWGTINGPKENNSLCYLIDCTLVILYWMLLNKRNNFTLVLLCYSLMFLLYYFWEYIRSRSNYMSYIDKIYKAMTINKRFFFITFGIAIAYIFGLKSNKGYLTIKFIYIFIMLIIIITYRYFIYFAYKDEKKYKNNNKSISNDEDTLIKMAKQASNNAKAHLSHYSVGAAILGINGKIYVGCNIEFDNYSNTIHAEEAALSALISDGELNFNTIAVFTYGDQVAFPCGMCRQSLYELGGSDLKIIACNETKCESKSIKQLLPEGFKL